MEVAPSRCPRRTHIKWPIRGRGSTQSGGCLLFPVSPRSGLLFFFLHLEPKGKSPQSASVGVRAAQRSAASGPLTHSRKQREERHGKTHRLGVCREWFRSSEGGSPSNTSIHHPRMAGGGNKQRGDGDGNLPCGMRRFISIKILSYINIAGASAASQPSSHSQLITCGAPWRYEGPAKRLPAP